MNMTMARSLPAFLLPLILSASPLPIYAGEQATAKRQYPAASSTRRRIELFSPTVRRSTISYLRLRLLELREEDLERARAAIERRLSVDELIDGKPRPHDARISRERESRP